jgi:hypothetical protein
VLHSIYLLYLIKTLSGKILLDLIQGHEIRDISFLKLQKRILKYTHIRPIEALKVIEVAVSDREILTKEIEMAEFFLNSDGTAFGCGLGMFFFYESKPMPEMIDLETRMQVQKSNL